MGDQGRPLRSSLDGDVNDGKKPHMKIQGK